MYYHEPTRTLHIYIYLPDIITLASNKPNCMVLTQLFKCKLNNYLI